MLQPFSGQGVIELSAVGYKQWEEEREPRWLGTGGKLEENHFALSWGGLCAGSGISGAG